MRTKIANDSASRGPLHQGRLRPGGLWRMGLALATAFALVAGVLTFGPTPSAADPIDRHPGTGGGPERTPEQEQELYDMVVRAKDRVTHHQDQVNLAGRQMVTEMNRGVPSLDRYAQISERMQQQATQLNRAQKQLEDRMEEYHGGTSAAAGVAQLTRYMRNQDPELWDTLDALIRDMVRNGRRSDNIIDLRSEPSAPDLSANDRRTGPSFRELTALGQFLLEQEVATEGRTRLAMIPDICYTADGVFRSSYCRGFQTLEDDGRRLIGYPRYCRERQGVFQCANHNAAVPTNKAKPAFGNFLCARNHVVYWSNGTNAYSQVDQLNSLRRCPDVDGSWIFTGAYTPETGGGPGPRPPGPRDCPNDVDEQGNVRCKDDKPVAPPRPPADNYGCIQHDKNNLWKCPGDTTYHRPQPVDTSQSGGDQTDPAGHQHNCSTGRHYWVKGDRYWQQTQKDRIKTCPELESQGLRFQQWRWDANGDRSQR